jgi:class 3 adenylate cyclase
MERRLAAILAADIVGYSRLMGEDETGTLADLHSLHAELIDPAVARHHGRIVKRMGDGVLAEFGSVVEAVQGAAEIQRAIAARPGARADSRCMALRIGVHLGDIIHDGDDIYGDGVNIAARLQGFAEAGGICISRQAFDQVEGKLSLGFRALGPQSLKNIARPVDVYALDPAEAAAGSDAVPEPLRQEIRYCRAPDGVRLAWARVGAGPPLVRAANWLTHLEYDWQSPLRRGAVQGLSRRHTLIRYDPRGCGLSDWDVDELSLDAWVSDLETVVEAAGLQRFALFGASQACAVSIAYAVRHPARLSHLFSMAASPGAQRSGRRRRRSCATRRRPSCASAGVPTIRDSASCSRPR